MEYVPIRISTLKKNSDLGFDLHIKLKSKYLLYVHAGDNISPARLDKLKDKRVKQLFISDDDEKKYQAFLDNALTQAAEDPNMPKEEKAEIASSVASGAAEDIQENPDSVDAYKMCEKASAGINSIVGNNPDILKHIFERTSKTDQEKNVAHSVTTSSLCVRMANHLKMEPQQINNLGIAGLMHDIGIVSFSKEKSELQCTDYSKFSVEDLTLYKTHPMKGAELLANKPYINPDILDLILHHEERISGVGFPKGNKTITLIQEVLAICSWYSRKTICLGIPHKDAIRQIQVEEVGNFNLELLTKFAELLKKEKLGSIT